MYARPPTDLVTAFTFALKLNIDTIIFHLSLML